MVGRHEAIVVVALGTLAGAPAAAQEFFRCTSSDGKVTYQQAPCPKTDAQTRIDATPANTDYDPAKREQILKQGEEATRRLEERAAKEREEARLREEARQREAQREREAMEREAAREMPVYVIGGAEYAPWPPLPRPSPPAKPPPRPQPLPSRP
jgi:hypothetical protein